MTPLTHISQQLEQSNGCARRVMHGRGRAFEGWEEINIEWYPPYLLVQNFGDVLSEEKCVLLREIFSRHCDIEAILVQQREWPDFVTQVLCARRDEIPELPWQGWVKLAEGIEVAISLGKNRNTGAFLDMRAGWQWLLHNGKNRKVLNLFCYTGIFSLFALKGGASRVDNVDMAANVLKIAQRNHQHNQVHDGQAAFYKRDILKSARWLESRTDYDMIVLDPPPYQKKAFRGWSDYEKLLTMARGSLKPGGQLFCCLNNPQVSIGEFERGLRSHFPDASAIETLASAPEIREANIEKGLKTLIVTL